MEVRGVIIQRPSAGFTLPTVLIVSIMMLAVLAAALQLVSTTSASLRDQYYTQLAREAAEAGATFIGECIKQGYFLPEATLGPGTNCAGGTVSGRHGYVISTTELRTTFQAKYTVSGTAKKASVTGRTEFLRQSDGTVSKQYAYTTSQQVTQEVDPAASRASRRWWYFGQNVRLDFGVTGAQGPISSTTTGAAASTIKAEGVTTVSDRQGNLLFYSDGLTIWNRNGAVMSNSTGLSGSSTATQAVAAFPINKEETLYVVISNSANGPDGSVLKHGELYYTVVDMTKQSGLGEVLLTAKNKRMGGLQYSSEALGAAPNLAGDGYWVYTYTPNPVNNKIWGFQIREKAKSDSTYAADPVRYSTSDVINAYDINAQDVNYRVRICPLATSNTTNTAFGSVNFNGDYSKMILYMGGASCTDGYANAGTIHLLSVNRETGYLSKVASWFGDVRSGLTNRPAGYSADFSPSGSYVYTAQIYPGGIYRYDIRSGQSSTIKGSERFIGVSSCGNHVKADLPYSGVPSRTDACVIANYSENDGGGQILRGPDGRMYIADRGTRHLSRINNPDAPNGVTGAATAANVGWQYAVVRLPDAAMSFYGLPQMVTLYSPRILQY